MGDRSRTSDPGQIYSKLYGCGWQKAMISIETATSDEAIIHLRLAAGHVLRVRYDLGLPNWQGFELWLLGDSTSSCEPPPAMRVENISRAEATIAAQSIPDILLLKAYIAQRLRTTPLADIQETVDEIVDLRTWRRERLFMAAAWLMANGWPTADTSISAASEDDHLRRLIKFALGVNARIYRDALLAQPGHGEN